MRVSGPGRIAGGLALVGLGFLALRASDPGIVFSSVVQGRQMAFFTPENRFSTNESPPVVTVISTAHARTLRARLTACPAGLAGCRAGKPFSLELPASGQVELAFPESARPVTLDLQRVPWQPLYGLFLVLLGAGLGLIFRDPLVRRLLLAVLLTGGLYFSQTLGELRSLDVGGHLEHVTRIATDGFFVNAQACWECFHPPLYYAVASAALGFPAELRPSAATMLQGLALLLYCLSVPLVVAALRPMGRTGWLAALVLLWPAAVLQSARLGNDGPLDLCAFAMLLLLLRGRLVAAALVAAIALLVKDSALVLVALVGAWGAYGAFRARDRAGAGGVLLLGVLASRISARLKHFHPARMEALSEGLRVRNTPTNVLLPDPFAFLREPFVNPWQPGPNRDHVLNYFWKTSLFGEWGYDFPGANLLAVLLSALLLAVLAAAAVAWWRSGRQPFPALLVAAGLGAVMAYRVIHPFACNPDFRFVYPPVALGVGLALAPFAGRWWARGPVIAFLGLSEVIFVLHWWFES